MNKLNLLHVVYADSTCFMCFQIFTSEPVDLFTLELNKSLSTLLGKKFHVKYSAEMSFFLETQFRLF